MNKYIHKAPARTDQTVDRVIDGEALIVEPQPGMVNVLNVVGTRIWELIDGRRTTGEIAGRIGAEFDADPDMILEETVRFLQELRMKGWIEYRP